MAASPGAAHCCAIERRGIPAGGIVDRRREVLRLEVGGRTAWFKRYGGSQRSVRMRALDWVAQRLGVIPLRAPPRRVGAGGRHVEERRLAELAALDVPVPKVLARGQDCLVLSDMGQTLAHRLRRSTPEEARDLVARAVEAVAQVHARGGYLGGPVARNLTVDAEGRIGFIDFEEDPGEVMPLVQAQARDWLVFSAGVARHVPFGEEELASILAAGLRREPEPLRGELGESVQRLSFLRRLAAWLGGRAAGLAKALASLQLALWSGGGSVLLAVLAFDLLTDGDLDLLTVLARMVD